MATKTLIVSLVREQFGDAPLDSLTVTTRAFPARVGADLQRTLDRLPDAGFMVSGLHAAMHRAVPHPAHDFTQIYSRVKQNPIVAAPPKYVEIDIGEAEPVRALEHGLLFVSADGEPLAVLLFNNHEHIHIHVAAHGTPAGAAAARRFLKHIEDGIARGECYRGKVLSIEDQEMYNGQGLGLVVHKLRPVGRDEVILPRRTLDLLDRNVTGFVKQRAKLAALGLSVKKGLLFYGPPGTGKTHTIHYLTQCLSGHTTFLIAAEQVGNLSEYMTLARLFQPSLVVLEDVDLIAREREDMRSAGEEVLLNKLLNEMDGLRADAEILFILTTNRPEALESALASRPGRVDQAVEFPLPDPDGRLKLVRLYSQGVPMAAGVADLTVARTDKVTASFVKELMRRAIQYALSREAAELRVEAGDVTAALDELLVAGGSLNRKLLGAAGRDDG